MGKILICIVAWAVISFILAYFNIPKIVVQVNDRDRNYGLVIRWLILFLLPIILVLILMLVGVITIVGLSAIGIILIIIAIFIIVILVIYLIFKVIMK